MHGERVKECGSISAIRAVGAIERGSSIWCTARERSKCKECGSRWSTSAQASICVHRCGHSSFCVHGREGEGARRAQS